MQDKHLFDDKERPVTQREEAIQQDENTGEEGVVYVANEDGTPFDISDRTYVAVEGLEDVPGSDEKEDESDNDKA